MYSKKVVVISELGLYGRVATSLIQIANRYKSTIFVEYEDKKVNAKSLLGILSLALTKGCEISISASGVDEKEAVDDLVLFIESGGSSADDISHENDVVKDDNARDILHGQPDSSSVGDVQNGTDTDDIQNETDTGDVQDEADTDDG